MICDFVERRLVPSHLGCRSHPSRPKPGLGPNNSVDLPEQAADPHAASQQPSLLWIV